eukprot:SAG31_NODE_11075_length_1069_cov_0.990722_2_plen_121_part_00
MTARSVGTVLPDVRLRDAGAATFERVRSAIHRHGVVVLPAQNGLTPPQLHAFALKFGPIGLHLGIETYEHESLPGLLTLSDGPDEEVDARPRGASDFGTGERHVCRSAPMMWCSDPPHFL